MSETLNRDAVITIFKIILGRPPESDATIDNILRVCRNVDTLRNHLFEAPEFLDAQHERMKRRLQ